MFKRGCERARSFTGRVIISHRCQDGSIAASCGAFVYVNRDGWILTAKHIFDLSTKFQNDQVAATQYRNEIDRIHQDQTLDARRRKKAIQRLRADAKWITHIALWWNRDGVAINNIVLHPTADIAIGQLVPFDADSVQYYPEFRLQVGDSDLGGSLCKMGFPFAEIPITFNAQTGGFEVDPGGFQTPFFPLDGIFTRHIHVLDQATHQQVAKMIEMSSPGLPGQSGGPVFDIDGVIWGIQCSNNSFPLLFQQTPTALVDGKVVKVPQFINGGWAVAPETICEFLNANRVTFVNHI